MLRRALCRACFVLLLLAAAGPAAAQVGEAVDLELVLAIDVSGSVDIEEGRLQRDGYVQAFMDREVIAAIRAGAHRKIAVAYFEWSDYGFNTLVADWRVIGDETSARAFATFLANAPISRGRYTSISSAIDHAVPMFERNAHRGTRRVIDISGDGPNNNGRMVVPAREIATTKGITINGLPIINNKPDRFGAPMPNLDLYYRDCVIGGPGAFYIVADGFQAFAAAVRRKLILEIAGIVPREEPLLRLASEMPGPPCDEGERRLRERFGSGRF